MTILLLTRRFIMAAAALGAVALFTLAVWLAPSQAAESLLFRYKLSGTMQPAGDVGYSLAEPVISPDSQWVAYAADAVTDMANELFIVEIAAGATPLRVSGPLPAGTTVTELTWLPDSSGVVYLAEQTAGMVELFVGYVNGDPPRKLNAPLVSGGDVAAFRVSPSGGEVVYAADQDVDERGELFVVPTTGGVPQKLNPPLNATADVAPSMFQISPDGSRVLYLSDLLADGDFDLYSVPIGGGSAERLNSPLVAGGSVFVFRISPDSSRVVYFADQQGNGTNELYSVALSGSGGVVKLNPPLVAGGDVSITFAISPDSSHVVYIADQQVNERFDLFKVPLAGGTAVKLNALNTAGGNISDFQISSTSSRVVFWGDREVDEQFELYSVPLKAPTLFIIEKLNPPLDPGSDVLGFRLSPDGSRVIFQADVTDNKVELFSAPIGGGVVTKLNQFLPPTGVVYIMGIRPDSSRVVYRAAASVASPFELWDVPLAGGERRRLNGPLVGGGSAGYSVAISPDSTKVVYTADETVHNRVELYGVASFVIQPTPTPTTPSPDHYLPAVLGD